MRKLLVALALTTTLALPSAALAHTGHADVAGFTAGLAHPFVGLDHVLAMVSVGLFAAHLGGRALWAVPFAFVGAMAAGGAVGMAGVAIPAVETGVAVSVIALGAVVALGLSMPVAAAAGLAGFFAVFHGHAHGAEAPAAASGLVYAAGFILATASLHAAGIAAGLGLGRIATGAKVRRAAGGLAALAGVGLLAGLI